MAQREKHFQHIHTRDHLFLIHFGPFGNPPVCVPEKNISKEVMEGNLTKSILIFGVNRYHPSGYILCIKTKSIILNIIFARVLKR